MAALESLQRVILLHPDLPEAKFNYALTLEKLHLNHQARFAWAAYLELDPFSPWAREAEDRLRSLSTGHIVPWVSAARVLNDALGRADVAAATQIVTTWPMRARNFAHDHLLAEWARATAAGEVVRASQALSKAQLLGRLLAEYLGDDLIAKEIASLTKALESSEGSVEFLVQGYLALAKGRQLVDEARDEEALPVFRLARRKLTRGGSALRFVAALEELTALHYQGHLQAAANGLERMLSAVSGSRFPLVQGRAHWVLGLIYLKLAQLTRSLEEYQGAMAPFSRVQDGEAEAAIRFLIAENLRYQGDAVGAWQYRLEALKLSSAGGHTRWLHNTLLDAAEACLREHRYELALRFQHEMVLISQVGGDLLTSSEALIRRSETKRLLKDYVGALQDLAVAESALGRLPATPSRIRLEADLVATSAAVHFDSGTSNALNHIDAAIRFYGNQRIQLRLPRLFSLRADALLHTGDIDRAEDELGRALAEVGKQEQEILDPFRRAAYRSYSRRLFDQMIELQVLRRGNHVTALDLVERERSSWAIPSERGQINGRLIKYESQETIHHLQQSLPGGIVALEYVVLESKTYAWLISNEVLRFEVLRVTREALAGKIERFNSALLHNDLRGIRHLAMELDDLLVAPFSREITAARGLVIAPDRELHSLPFNVLLGRQSQQYLVERTRFGVAPSIGGYLTARQRLEERRHFDPALDLVAFLAPTSQRSEPTLPELTAARGEIGLLRRLYPRMLAFEGMEASRAAFLQHVGSARTLYLAVHAMLNSESPDLSQLVFADLPSAGSHASSSVLARDLYNLDLMATQLVILAACESAAGPLFDGEGTMSLVRPWLSVGVPAVIGSLWYIDDKTASTLLTAVHQGIAQQVNPLDALRLGQLAAMRNGDPMLSAPRTWGSFQLFGGFLP